MKTKLFFRLILTGLILFIFTTDISAQINDWNDVVDHAVLGYGEEGEWDDRQVWNPEVIKDGDTLRMFYTGGYEICWEYPKTKIGYAWSLDGINWIRHIGNPVLTAEFDWEEDYLFGCAVIKDSDTMKMWYGCGYPGPAIGYATSMDGKNWNKHPTPVLNSGPVSEWDDGFIVPTTVIKNGDLFKLWYWAGRPGWPNKVSMPQTGLATSSDGINWTKYNDTTTGVPFLYSDPVLKHGSGDWDEDRVIFPMVLKKESEYEVWYVGGRFAGLTGQHIGYAQSDDGINWVKHPEPVLTSPRSWGSTIYGGSVLTFDNKYHLWYACFTTELAAGPMIGYATAPNPTGIASPRMGANVRLFPNPFTTSTTIEYELTNPSSIQITIYNHLGEQVELIEKKQLSGKQQVVWNAEGLPAGVYYCVLKTDNGTQTMKMVKLK